MIGIDVTVKLTIKKDGEDLTLELSKIDAEALYAGLGALLSGQSYAPTFVPYPVPYLVPAYPATPYIITTGTGTLPFKIGVTDVYC